MKGDKGITLIALVITIIIMLILAGVTLNAALGENGLIQRAKQASEAYRKVAEEESNGIENLVEVMEKINEGREPEPEPTQSPEPTPTPGLSAKDLNDKVNNGQAADVLGKQIESLELSSNLEGKDEYKWQIFNVDESHIWLISKDYISVADCPAGKRRRDGYDSIKLLWSFNECYKWVQRSK